MKTDSQGTCEFGSSSVGTWDSTKEKVTRLTPWLSLSEAKDLRHVTIHTTTDIINGRMVYRLSSKNPPNCWLFLLQTVFPISYWLLLEHFSMSNILVTLATLLCSTRSIELNNLRLIRLRSTIPISIAMRLLSMRR